MLRLTTPISTRFHHSPFLDVGRLGDRGHPHRKSPSEGLASIPAQDAARTSAFPGLSPFLNQRGLLLMKMFKRPPGEPMNAAQAAQKTGLHEHTTVSAHLVSVAAAPGSL